MSDLTPHSPRALPEELKRYARAMRKNMPDAEALCWSLLRNRRMANAKFRRQHVIGSYIIDFYCAEYQLAIELDGGQHSEQQDYDRQRDAYLRSLKITTLRFWNHQMLNETEAVLEAIYHALQNKGIQ
ncbi:MAG: endonuclease domain-containing protein [Undibacterium curvum]|uniref:endonuclease domain-containing protein n=1 Tax=Undibacterium curvum TaxID=2762294 RepID=UPI003BD0DFAB